MDSFKQNLILFATFSIGILYMITSAHADAPNANAQKCFKELIKDEFNININHNSQNSELAHTPTDLEYNRIIKNVNTPTTPYGKTYYSAFHKYEVYLYPIFFCMWINGHYVYSNPRLYGTRSLLLEVLNTYKNIDKCFSALRDDKCNMDLVNYDTITSPYGKAYGKLIMFYKAKMETENFCLWIHRQYVDPNVDSSILKGLMGDITTNMCLDELISDKIDIDKKDWREYLSFMLNITEDQLQTKHGKAFREIILQSEKTKACHQTAKYYCKNYNADVVWKLK